MSDKTYCSYCEKQVEYYWEDCGIGAYEYWGYKGVDSDVRAICQECDNILVDQPEVEIDDYPYPDNE